MEKYAMKLMPAYKDYIWGGQKLNSLYGKHSGLERTAESWELSCHKDGKSIIGNGEYKGTSLSDYLNGAGLQVLGKNCARFKVFPVLIKLIDAHDNLSVQVHPGDDYAFAHEGEYGKTEMWYVVDCEEGASLLYGLKRSITKEEFRKRIENNTLLEVLRSVPVKKGDVFMIESGTIHAIGKGILIAEIQQNSNTTYRVYDYGRKGKDGKPRLLHIDKAVDVASLFPVPPASVKAPEQFDGYTGRQLASCRYFSVRLLDVSTGAALNVGEDSFQSFTCVDGELFLETAGDSFPVRAGDTVFLPAGLGNCSLKGSGKVLLTYIEP